ncbi:MAG: cysteine--tRNA ligase [Gemmataceae bacterium]
MALRVYNTLTGEKSLFETVEPGKVRMYVCGPTVYKPSHVGHMVGPVIFDTIKRYLEYSGYDVTFVVNITDVDDKLINEAKVQNTTVPELAERVTKDYFENLSKLNVTSIDKTPKATEHIGNIIEIIQGLIDKDYAYAAGGDVYFDVTKDDDYGKLCGRDPEQLEAGARIEVSAKKRNPSDFALWKGAKPGEPQWESPWGPGRPGWHIECSAMSMKLLGETLDIHGGGLDLQFPHHENELAQSESFTGKPFARYWMHNGLIMVGDKKMGKSEGNTMDMAELLSRHQPETIRFFLLATHYRRPTDYKGGEERLAEIRRGLDNFYRFFERYERITGVSFYALEAPRKKNDFDSGDNELLKDIAERRHLFLEHMDDDFNTGGGVGILYEMLPLLNRFVDQQNLESSEANPKDKATLQKAAVVLKELGQILGVFEHPQEEPGAGEQDELVPALMQLLIDVRQAARKAKNFDLSDMVRDRLGELSITLEDRKEGTTWRKG